MTKVTYTATIDGEERSGSYVVEYVTDRDITDDEDVLLAYAQHFAIEDWGYRFNVNEVEIEVATL